MTYVEATIPEPVDPEQMVAAMSDPERCDLLITLLEGVDRLRATLKHVRPQDAIFDAAVRTLQVCTCAAMGSRVFTERG